MQTELAIETLNQAIKNKHATLLTGSPGVGKTALMALSSQLMGADFYPTHPIVEDPTDKKGMPWVIQQNDMGMLMRSLARLLVDLKTGGKSEAEMLASIDKVVNSYATPKATFLPFDEMDVIMNAEKPTVVALDDLGQAPPAIQASNMHLLLARRIGSRAVSDHVIFFAATNRRTDMAGVSGILEPVKSRFPIIIEIEADPEGWCRWAIANGVPFEVVAFIRYRPNLLSDFTPTKDMVNSPSPRTWDFVGQILNGGYPAAAHRELVCKAVGEGAGIEFMSFLKIYRELENPDMVIMDPMKAKIPKEPSALYALLGALAARASDQNFGQIVKYCNRLDGDPKAGAEFNVLCIKDCTTKDRNLLNTKAYIEWSLKHSDVLT